MKLETVPVKKEVEVKQPTDHELMELAKFLVSQGWNQNCGATDINGRFCATDSADARNYCVVGAIWRALHDTAYGMSEKEQYATSRRLGFTFLEANEMNPSLGDIPDWNDAKNRTKEQVLAAFDNAIAVC